MQHHHKNVDEEFLNAGRKEGLEIWRIDHFKVTPIPEKCYGLLDSYFCHLFEARICILKNTLN